MKKTNLSVTGTYDDDLFKQLFGDDIFSINGTKMNPSAIEEECEDSSEPKDFYIEQAIKDGEYQDNLYRDRYGNYLKNTYYYQKMKEADFPFGDDRSPNIEAEDDFLYY